MKTKRKALLLTLCALLLVVASVMGTMAYLVDTKTVENTFTMGQVKIKLDEVDASKTDGSRTEKGNSYKLIPGTTYPKDPTVTVLKGSEESYVRMKVTFNNAAALMEMLPDPEDLAEYDPEDEKDTIEAIKKLSPILFLTNYDSDTMWLPELNMTDMGGTISNPKYFVYDAQADTVTFIFYWYQTVKATDADVKLPAVFTEIELPGHVTAEQLAKLNNFRITAVAEAIQAGTFENADAAWAAFEAQK